ncbi:uncharacterized protein LOC131667195 [Phymastichus coffea]|uniref:uncharacterized protein LOC131667195 n=1 Tax=Phymastichus coffea TaxID=108790 RepID=UPI00273C49C3|nr:uncharacterized protein LOC131667195 [Phymastichus coffea]
MLSDERPSGPSVENMNFENECCHLKINRFLLSCFGLWPYHSIYFKCCCILLFLTWIVSSITAMIQGLGDKTSTDIGIIFETAVSILTMMGSLAQHRVLIFNSAEVRSLYERMERDWKAADFEERMIMKEFWRQGRKLSYIFAVLGLVCFAGQISLTYLPLVFAEDVEKNYSKIFPYYSHRWIISDDHRNLQVFVHGSLGYFYAGFSYTVVCCLYMSNTKHICAMYEIVCAFSFRLGNLVRDGRLATASRKEEKERIVSETLTIIGKHREAIESVRIINRIFSLFYFFVQIGFLAALAMLIFDVRSSKLTWSPRRIAVTTGIHIAYEFFLNYAGEQVIEYSSKVLTSTHFMQWYLLPRDAKKLLLMISQRGLKVDTLDAGIMTCTLENFTQIIKASWSLACVLLSTQKEC